MVSVVAFSMLSLEVAISILPAFDWVFSIAEKTVNVVAIPLEVLLLLRLYSPNILSSDEPVLTAIGCKLQHTFRHSISGMLLE